MRDKRLFFAFLAGCIGGMFLLNQGTVLAQVPTYTVGVMAKSYDEKRTKAMEKFEEIIGKYLEDRAGVKIRLKALTYPDLMKAIETGSVDFIWGYGLVVSMELAQKYSLIPLVAPTLGEEKRAAYRRFVVSAKNSVQKADDLKGKRLAHLGDEAWNFELLMLKIWVAEHLGVKDIRQLLDLKGKQPDEGFFIPASKRGSVYSLIIREADLAVAHEFEYITQERLTPHAVRERTEVLSFFNYPEGYLEAPVFIRRGTTLAGLDRLVRVLLEMPSDPEGKQILISSKISGFVRVTDQDYQGVRALVSKKDKLGIQ